MFVIPIDGENKIKLLKMKMISCFIGFIHRDDWLMLKRILRRLACITGRNKNDYTVMILNRLETMVRTFAIKFMPEIKPVNYNLRTNVSYSV